MAGWYRGIEEIVPTFKGSPFHVFVDMRTLIPLRDDAREIITKGQRFCQKNGMVRSIVITASPVISMQFKSIAFNTTIATGERYIDATSRTDWEEAGMAWLLEGIDPTQKVAPVGLSDDKIV